MAKLSQFAKIALPFAKISVFSARWSGLNKGEFIFVGDMPITWIGIELVKRYM